jgi:hypothetical protein
MEPHKIEKEEIDMKKEELAELLKAELAPVVERLETVEKTRGISKSADTDEAKVEKSEDNVWAGLL